MSDVEKIASDLEDEIAHLKCGMTYEEIVRVAIFTAKKTRDEIPMYTGNLNPKWALWNDVIVELGSRV